MSGRWRWSWPHADFPTPDFPNLIFGAISNHKVTSWATKRYNCIAWAADDDSQPWWPQSYDAYWPPTAINDITGPAFVSAFETLGYVLCNDDGPEIGFEKVVIYTLSNGEPTHAARQLRNGKWTSKLGDFADVQHNKPEDVNGPAPTGYGAPKYFLKRPPPRFNLRRLISRIWRFVRRLFWEVNYMGRRTAEFLDAGIAKLFT